MGVEIYTDICPRTLSVPRTVSRNRSTRATQCELRGTDNVQGQLFVHISEAKSSLLSLVSFKHLFLTARREAKQKTRSKTRRLFGAFWHCFLNKFPNFLIGKLKKNAPFRSLLARRGLLAVSGHYDQWNDRPHDRRLCIKHILHYFGYLQSSVHGLAGRVWTVSNRSERNFRLQATIPFRISQDDKKISATCQLPNPEIRDRNPCLIQLK